MREDASRLVEILWAHPASSGRGTLLDEARRESQLQSIQLKMSDPDNDAGEAMTHLLSQLPAFVHLFVQPDGTIDPASFRKWSRTVLRNRMLELKRKLRPERGLQQVEPELLDTFAARSAEADTPDRPWPTDVESMLTERDKLLLMLELLLQLDELKRDLLLARMAGFSRSQVTECLPYTEASQSVVVSRLRAHFQARPTEFDAERPRLYDDPNNDPPLVGPDVPFLTQALKALGAPAGTHLLLGTVRLRRDLKLVFQSRLAGFWDCVIASGMELALADARSRVLEGREKVEAFLANRQRGTGRPDGSSGASATKGIPTMKSHTPRRSDTAQRMSGLLELADRDPAQALAQLFQDPEVSRGLARGRRHNRAQEAQAAQASEARAQQAQLEREPLLSLAERLWKLAGEALADAQSWLELPLGSALAVRGVGEDPTQPVATDPTGVEVFPSSNAAYRVVTFTPALAKTPDACTFVYQLEGDQLKLVYPKPHEPCENAQLPGRSFIVRGSTASTEVRLLVVQVEASHLPRFASGTAREAALMAWLRGRLEARDRSGIKVGELGIGGAGGVKE